MSVEEVLLAEPRGFCAGVDRAIEIVERALHKFGAPIYVRHEIVHNTYVVEDLKKKGAIFIEDLADVPPGATLVFSAHGVSQAVRKEAAGARLLGLRRDLPARHQGPHRGRQAGQGRLRVHHDRPQGPPRGRGHDGPARSTASTWSKTSPTSSGSWSPQGQPLAVVTQTTLSVDDAAEILAAVKRRFPDRAPAEAAGHLLRDAEPAGRGQGARPRRRRAGRRRQPEQQQQQPPARARRAARRRRLHGRHRRRPARRVVRRQAPGRPHRRRVGARSAGAGRSIERLRALGAVSVRTVPGTARAGPLPAADGPRRQGDARRRRADGSG